MTLPNFLIIGANRSGTTSLHYYLGQHPQIFMSANKEPHFFMLTGIAYDTERPDKSLMRNATFSLSEYTALFADAGAAKAIGEASTGYLAHPNAPIQIHKFIPDCKLIAILRNPVERAYSAFIKNIERGVEPLYDFGQAVEKELAGGDWRFYVSVGFYARQLKTYAALFPKSQLRVYLYEDLHAPQKLMLDIFTFLDVDASFQPNLATQHNPSRIPLHRLRGVDYWRMRYWYWRNSRSRNPGAPPRVAPPLKPAVRRKLIEHYRADMLELEQMLDRDLSTWFAYS